MPDSVCVWARFPGHLFAEAEGGSVDVDKLCLPAGNANIANNQVKVQQHCPAVSLAPKEVIIKREYGLEQLKTYTRLFARHHTHRHTGLNKHKTQLGAEGLSQQRQATLPELSQVAPRKCKGQEREK